MCDLNACPEGLTEDLLRNQLLWNQSTRPKSKLGYDSVGLYEGLLKGSQPFLVKVPLSHCAVLPGEARQAHLLTDRLPEVGELICTNTADTLIKEVATDCHTPTAQGPNPSCIRMNSPCELEGPHDAAHASKHHWSWQPCRSTSVIGILLLCCLSDMLQSDGRCLQGQAGYILD